MLTPKKWHSKIWHWWIQAYSWGKMSMLPFFKRINNFIIHVIRFLRNLSLPKLPEPYADKETDSIFYYTSTTSYKEFLLDRRKYLIISTVTISILVVNGLFSIESSSAIKFKEAYPLFCGLISVLAIPSVWLATIAVAFLINANFYNRSTLSEIAEKNRIKFNLVRPLIHMAIKASEVEVLCCAKKGCYVFDERKMRCEPDLNRCGETDADPVKEFPDEHTGDDQSCQLLKHVHREYLIMQEDIADCFKQASIHFPELMEPIEFPYKKYARDAQRYRFISFNYCTFFDTIQKLPFKLVDKYSEDSKFIEDVKRIFFHEYEEYKKRNIPRSWSNPGLSLGLSIKTETVFKPFQMFLSESISLPYDNGQND